jgi:hypothetical protein
VNVGTDEPEVKLIFNLLEVVAPAVPPKLNVLVLLIPAVIFEVPVKVKFVTVAIDKTVAPVVPEFKAILPVPKAIALVFEPLALNAPVLN